jgi:hypothetical protein
VIAGCGSGGDDSIGFGQVAQASEATSQVQGADMTLRMTIQAAGLPRPITMTGSGVENPRKRSGRFTLDMSHLADASNGQIPAGAKMEEIVAYPVIYMRSPLLNQAVPDGKWAKLDLQASGKEMGIDFNSLMQNDPTQTLRSLRVSGENVKRVGPERIRGVQTTHYTATMNLRKGANLFPPGPKRDAARKSIDRLIQLSGEDSYPVAVWIDSHKLVRRMSMSMNMKVQGQQMKMDMSFDLFNFGPKPAVKPPPASDVVDLPASGAQTGP